MTTTLTVETAQRNLKDLLTQLHLGETLTLTGAEGKPLAVLISLETSSAKTPMVSDWNARWDVLAQEIGSAWQSDKSAVEILAEMRR